MRADCEARWCLEGYAEVTALIAQARSRHLLLRYLMDPRCRSGRPDGQRRGLQQRHLVRLHRSSRLGSLLHRHRLPQGAELYEDFGSCVGCLNPALPDP